MRTFFLKIITPAGVVFSSDIEEFHSATSVGKFVVLAGYEPFFMKLRLGKSDIIQNNSKEKIEVFLNNALLKVENNQAVVTAEEAFLLKDINMDFAISYMNKDKKIGNMIADLIRAKH